MLYFQIQDAKTGQILKASTPADLQYALSLIVKMEMGNARTMDCLLYTSNNLAIFGAAQARRRAGKRIVTTAVELSLIHISKVIGKVEEPVG